MSPPPKLTVSEWADEHFYLSPESSAQPGKWRTIPFQRGWMDAVSDPKVEKISVMKSARIGYTKSIDCIIGYHAHHDPCSILILQPTDDDAKGFSTEEVQPMFRDVPVLAGLLNGRDADGRKERQTMRKLQTRGGMLYFSGAKSTNNLRRITVRKVIRDEIDAYVTDNKEGDVIALSEKRMGAAMRGQSINGSTPTLKGFSLIEREFEAGDQRHYKVPCPHCGHKQKLVWGTNLPHGVKWPVNRPREAYYVCEENGCIIEEKDKSWMVANGEWVAEKEFKGHASFHINALYSPFPKAKWGVLAEEFLAAKAGGPATLQPFVNTVLGETWDAGVASADVDALLDRRVEYGPNELPGDAVVVTAGIDIQDDRFEIEFVGWEPNNTTWSLDYVKQSGNPGSRQFWALVEEQLARRFTKSTGHQFGVEAACIDSGGHHTDDVYKYCRHRFSDRIYAIKGVGTQDAPIWSNQRMKNVKNNAIVFPVGVHAAKMKTHMRLQAAENEGGFLNFPLREPYSEVWFEEFTSEKLIETHKSGFPVRSWQKKSGARNEPWDCRQYATAARESLNVDLYQRLNRLSAGVPLARPVRKSRSRVSSFMRPR